MVEKKTVATPSDGQAAIAALAALPRTLMGGTAAMRLAGKMYLPKAEAETEKAYEARKARTTLFNAFSKTVSDMTGKVFDKPIVLGDDVPPDLVKDAENIDLEGRHLTVFARDVFFDALQPGISYILVDMPPAPVREDGRPETLAEEKARGARPYMVNIPVERLLGWKSNKINGAEVLTQVRILESVTEEDGDFHEKVVEQVRVLTPGAWQTWRKSTDPTKKDEWVPYENGTNSLKKITLVPVYTQRTRFMGARPPLEKLAELNVTHWQSSSDQRNILHIARVPILFGAGFGETDTLNIGSSEMVRSSDPNAKLGYVEHSGKAISSGRDDLKDLEFQMQAMGLHLLIPEPGGQSATGEMRDDSKENAPLAMMARSLGDALEEALGYMAEYRGLGEPGGSVVVNTDFGIAAGAMTDIPNIIAAKNASLISHETALVEMKRRAFLSDDLDIEAEIGRVEAEAPELDADPLPGDEPAAP